MVRTRARENAFLLLFQTSFNGADVSDILSANAEVGEIETDEFCEKLINGVLGNKDEIDAVIETLRSRLDDNGYTEATITRQDAGLRVEIPAIDNPDEVMNLIAFSMGQIDFFSHR